MIQLCTFKEGPFAEKTRQMSQLPEGTLTTYGLRPTWIHPATVEDVLKLDSEDLVELCLVDRAFVSPVRVARVMRVKNYSCPCCLENTAGYIRIDLMLSDEAVSERSPVPLWGKGHLVWPKEDPSTVRSTKTNDRTS